MKIRYYHINNEYRLNPLRRILPFLRHLLPLVIGVHALPIIGTLSFLAIPTVSDAQVLDEAFTEDTDIKSLPERSLRLDIDATGFFRDNEYQSEVQNGYSLPGVRLTPHIAYNPLKQINIEAGASMLFFNGANRYPCFAYHDIAIWKGNQYQRGCHVLPWVRMQASFKHIDIIAGNIYGASNHQLITPLYNAEQNISADPEMGVQILLHRPHILLDTWLNWQSYIFETDTHQEAFTVGTTAKILWNKQNAHNSWFSFRRKPKISLYTPVQLVIQHRGGEQDITNFGVQTICNASIGLGLKWKDNRKFWHKGLTELDAQVNGLACYQQSGKLWPFETGFATHTGIHTKWFNHLHLGADYVYIPKQFVSMYGNPFYSSISIKYGGTQINDEGTICGNYNYQYEQLHNFHCHIGYQYTFAQAYTLGADAELFHLRSNKRTSLDGNEKLRETNFSFGLYLKISPSIILKQFKR